MRERIRDIDLMVEAAIGINPELLINMQNRYNMAVARCKLTMINHLNAIRKACAAVLA